MVQSLAKISAVVVATTICSTLAVNAIDVRGDWARTMLGSIFSSVQEVAGPCPIGMQLVTAGLEPFCIDRYEVSTGKECPDDSPESHIETERNLMDDGCQSVSETGRLPWRYISQHEATLVCARSGKRLPSAREWYLAALGTQDGADVFTRESCNSARNRADGVAVTGGGMRCVSDAGVYDMVGNVWEWVAEEVHQGTWSDRTLPASGFVSGADLAGVAYETGGTGATQFSGDRYTLDVRIHAGMLRGGYYDSGVSAGVYALYAASPPEFTGEAVGFRCVMAPHMQ